MLRVRRASSQFGVGNADTAFSDFFFAYDELKTTRPALFALVQLNLGVVLVHAGDWEGAQVCFSDAMLAEGAVEIYGFAIVARCNLAFCCLQTQQHERARELIGEALRLDRSFVFKSHIGDLFTTIAENLLETGHYAEAQQYVADMMQANREKNFVLGIGTSHYCLGRLAQLNGRREEALHQYACSLRSVRKGLHLMHRFKLMRHASEIYAARGDWFRAWKWQRCFHIAYLRWETQNRPVRLAYARQRIELESTRAQRDLLAAENTQVSAALAQLEATHRELQSHTQRIEALQIELHNLSIRDSLTGALNRREMMRLLDEYCAQATPESQLWFGMIDLDHFKDINDRHGHAIGDAAVHFVATQLTECLGPHVAVCRWGGDEFCVASRGIDVRTLHQRFAKFSTMLQHWRPPNINERRGMLSASIGLSAWGKDGKTPNELLDAADTALYRVKKGGRGFIAHS
jgi:diguanylate cyclase (GGDEF)-like protein